MNEKLHGKLVAITGASSGIGAAVAERCAASGASVVLLARSEDKLQELVEHIQKEVEAKGTITAFALDVQNRNQVESVFTRIARELSPVDVLVNNAGYGVFDEFVHADLEDADGMFQTNVLGLMSCTKQVVPAMRHKGAGHIINVASQAGKLATPKSSVYSASKHAVLGFTNSLRMEMARDGIYVTSVNPGPVATNFFSIADESGTYLQNIKQFMLSTEVVADAIVQCMFTRKREINLPRWMNMGSILYALSPSLVEFLGKRAFFSK
ncbi:SDR family NAD(P)-dependent oxidoreductase [Bacillus fonticola]|uniref:SDR family NAD(P)-dependent oxidoreductase n=1 Tax=Bacillus fonticola TaxID=2728853 RepID=UPI001475BA26|nr:SDR family oxidoreductase [Bacillus fonticola]